MQCNRFRWLTARKELNQQTQPSGAEEDDPAAARNSVEHQVLSSEEKVPNYIELTQEYCNLASRSILSTKQAERMGQLLALACDDQTLSLMFNEMDEVTFHTFGLTTHHNQSHRDDQSSIIKEYIIGSAQSHNIPSTFIEYYHLVTQSELTQEKANKIAKLLIENQAELTLNFVSTQPNKTISALNPLVTSNQHRKNLIVKSELFNDDSSASQRGFENAKKCDCSFKPKNFISSVGCWIAVTSSVVIGSYLSLPVLVDLVSEEQEHGSVTSMLTSRPQVDESNPHRTAQTQQLQAETQQLQAEEKQLQAEEKQLQAEADNQPEQARLWLAAAKKYHRQAQDFRRVAQGHAIVAVNATY